MNRLLLVLLALGVLTFAGCGSGEGREATAPVTPAQDFDTTHGGKTVTPHGMIVSGSAQNREDGRVQYKTEDGRNWKVQRRPDGTYETPEPVE